VKKPLKKLSIAVSRSGGVNLPAGKESKRRMVPLKWLVRQAGLEPATPGLKVLPW
jgi:hypothetical protein